MPALAQSVYLHLSSHIQLTIRQCLFHSRNIKTNETTLSSDLHGQLFVSCFKTVIIFTMVLLTRPSVLNDAVTPSSQTLIF